MRDRSLSSTRPCPHCITIIIIIIIIIILLTKMSSEFFLVVLASVSWKAVNLTSTEAFMQKHSPQGSDPSIIQVILSSIRYVLVRIVMPSLKLLINALARWRKTHSKV